MPLESILFAILLVLVIGLTLAFLLIKKPHFRFLGRTFRTSRSKLKSSADKTAKRRLKSSSRVNARTAKSDERSAARQTCESATEEPEPELVLRTSQPVGPSRVGGDNYAVLQSPEPAETAESTQEDTMSGQFAQLQGSPPDCRHFFGYLRKMPKDAAIPDGCLGCLKMVECLYYSNPSH
jgi:hypothetical protein